MLKKKINRERNLTAKNQRRVPRWTVVEALG
jgi:hypothetical protein